MSAAMDYFAGLTSGFNTTAPPATNPYGMQQQQPNQQQTPSEQGSVVGGVPGVAAPPGGEYGSRPPSAATTHTGNPYGYQQQQQQPVANDNPFAAYQQQQQQQQQAMVPVVNNQTNQWSIQQPPVTPQQQQQQQQAMYPNANMQGYHPQQTQPTGYPQPYQPQQQQQQQQQTMQQPPLARTLSNATSIAPSIASSYMTSTHTNTANMLAQSPQRSHAGSQMMTSYQQQNVSQQHLFAPQQTPQQQAQPPPTYQNYNLNMHPPQPLQPPQQQQQQQQQQAPPVAPPPVQPTPPAVETNVEDDEDLFGVFSTSHKIKQNNVTTNTSQPSPRHPPTEFETTDLYESVSVLSKSTNGTELHNASTAGGAPSVSPLDDPRFAPKPPKPHGLDNARQLAHSAPAGSSILPDYDLVTHSGYALARISFRTILIKKWKQVFWVTYGQTKLLVFRSSADFEDWVSNPYLNTAQREFLVKLNIDLVEDLRDKGTRGYQVTNQRLKNYNNKMLYQFKIERWMDYGPTIAAAFGSPNEREIFQLRTIFSEMLKRSPGEHAVRHNTRIAGNPNSGNGVVSALYPTPASGRAGVGGGGGGGGYHYSDAASTGRIPDTSHDGGRSVKSHGVYSTGPMERRSEELHQAVAGYHPTSRSGYRY